MRVHHLNCGDMRFLGLPLVCHVLLVEAPHGLVLVDAGFGLVDCAAPARRVGISRPLFHPALDPEQSAARQVERLGHARADVTDVVVTHFDLDHIGGLADFPHARVHTTAAEVLAATVEPTWRERLRYRPAQWAHGPAFVEHGPGGDAWRGFAAVRPLDEATDGIVVLPLPGHTRGHLAVAVDAGDRWLLHAGDAFYHPATIGGPGRAPRRLRALEAVGAVDRRRVRDNHARLAELRGRGDPDLAVFCAHDPASLAALDGSGDRP
ncbi:MAG: MBL fold metallo-hydrolase [Acidimicrobiia bacterium]